MERLIIYKCLEFLFLANPTSYHLSNRGIKYTINSLRIAFFGCLKYTKERSDVTSTKEALTLPPEIKNIPLFQNGNGFLALFEKKKYGCENRL